MFGLAIGRLGGSGGAGSGSAGTPNQEEITDAGGTVRDGEQFHLYYAAGGLTGATSVTIGGVACTSITVVDDYNLTATAPDDGLIHESPHTSGYTLAIS